MTEPDLPAAAPGVAGEDAGRRSLIQLLVGLLVFVGASFGALLAAGELGTSGVFLAVLIESAAIVLIYRWCEA